MKRLVAIFAAVAALAVVSPATPGRVATPTAICADGTYSYSATHSGTCSWHGGVDTWLDTTAPTPPPAQPAPVLRPSAQRCPKDLVALVNSLNDLDARLTVGLTYNTYAARLTLVSIAYNNVDVNKQSASCTRYAGVTAERAFNYHLKAKAAWNACIEAQTCDRADPILQRHWKNAHDNLERAKRNL